MWFSDSVTKDYNDLTWKLKDLDSQDINENGVDDKKEYHAALKEWKIILRNIEKAANEAAENKKPNADKLWDLYWQVQKEYNDLYVTLKTSVESEKSVSQSERMRIMLELSDITELADENEEISDEMRKRDKLWWFFSWANEKKLEWVKNESYELTQKEIGDFSPEEAKGALEYLNLNYDKISNRDLSFQRVGSDTIETLDGASEINDFQEELIKIILNKNNLNIQWFNNEYVMGFNSKAWNYLMPINHFEAYLRKDSTDIKDINSVALKNYFLHLEKEGTLKSKFPNLFNGEKIQDLKDIWFKDKNTNISIIDSITNSHKSAITKTMKRVLNSVWLDIQNITVSQDDKNQVNELLWKIDDLNKLPNEYFNDDKNFENIYLISDKTKLVEVLVYIAEQKNKQLDVEFWLNLLNIWKLNPKFQSDIQIIPFMDIQTPQDLSSLNNSFFEQKWNIHYLMSKIAHQSQMSSIHIEQSADRIVRRAMSNGIETPDILELLDIYKINEKSIWLSKYVKYKIFNYSEYDKLENSPENSYLVKTPEDFKKALPEFIDNYQNKIEDYEHSNIDNYLQTYWAEWVKESIPELLKIWILPENIIFDIDDKELIIEILSHKNNNEGSNSTLENNFSWISIIDKIPVDLRNDPDIIRAVIYNRSIDTNMLHVYVRNLNITNVNQLMLIFSAFKSRYLFEENRWGNRNMLKSEISLGSDSLNQHIIKEFFAQTWFFNLSMNILTEDITYIDGRYEDEYSLMIDHLKGANIIQNNIRNASAHLNQAVKNWDIQNTQSAIDIITEKFISTGVISKGEANSHVIQEQLTLILENPDSTMIVLRELSKFFENEPGKMEIFIKELSNIQLKELHKKQTNILDEITQNQNISYAQTADFLLNEKWDIDYKKLEDNFNTYILTLPEQRVWDKLWEDITINQYLQLNGIPEDFKVFLNGSFHAQYINAIKQNSDVIATNFTDPNLSDTEVEEKTKKIIQNHIKNHKFVSLSDIVEQIEEEEKTAIIENEVNENKTITEKNHWENQSDTLVKNNIPESVNILQQGSKFILQDTVVGTIELEEKEYNAISENKEGFENLISFRETLQECNLDWLWNFRSDIFKCLQDIGFNAYDGNYLSPHELKIFIATALNSLKDEIHTTIPSLDAPLGNFVEQVKVINKVGTELGWTQDYDLYWNSYITSLFREKFAPINAGNIPFKHNAFREAIHS